MNTQRNLEMVACYLKGQPLTVIAQVHGLSKSTVSNIITRFFRNMWVFILRDKVLHPYTERFTNAYHNGQFRPRNLSKDDLVMFEHFWTEQIKKYKLV
jgi:hypothetical protein